MKIKKSLVNQISGLIIWIISLCGLPLNANTLNRSPIFPYPQQLRVTGEVFTLDEAISIIIPVENSENDIFLARFLVGELSDKYGIAVNIEHQTEIQDNRKVVMMGRFDNPLIDKYCKENNIEINGRDPGSEGYILRVSPKEIIIAGSDDAGAFYGLQSLRQLLDAGNGKQVQGVAIKDWPDYPFRGIRLYVPGPENITFFTRFMKDFMSLYKFNKVILELN
jgi:hypothetical protein